MSQTKYPLHRETKNIAIAYVRKYKEYLKWYKEEQYNIVHRTGRAFEEMAASGETIRAYVPRGSGISDKTGGRALQLEELSQHPKVQRIRAVDEASKLIGMDIDNEIEQQRLRRAVWDSCIRGRDFDYTHHRLAMCKSKFYEYRREFLYRIATDLEI